MMLLYAGYVLVVIGSDLAYRYLCIACICKCVTEQWIKFINVCYRTVD